MTVHELKCHPDPFHAKWMGVKDWEIRKNDRNFKIGDLLFEREYFPLANQGQGAYGSEIWERVTWILPSGYGLQEGFIIMSTVRIKRTRVSGEKRESFYD